MDWIAKRRSRRATSRSSCLERWLQTRDERILEDIKAYNRDDCRSTHLLREWLLARREEAIAQFGIDFPFRPVKSPNDPCHEQFIEGCNKCVKRRNEEAEAARKRLSKPICSSTSCLRKRTRSMPSCIRASASAISWAISSPTTAAKRNPPGGATSIAARTSTRCLSSTRTPFDRAGRCETVEPYKLDRSVVYAPPLSGPNAQDEAGESRGPSARVSRPVTILSVTEDVENRLAIKTTAKLDAAQAITELVPPGPPSTKPQRKALGRIQASPVRPYASGEVCGIERPAGQHRTARYQRRGDPPARRCFGAGRDRGRRGARSQLPVHSRTARHGGKSTIGAQNVTTCSVPVSGSP